MSNIVNAQFEQGSTQAYIYEGVWQWDRGQILRIEGLSLPRLVEVHFSKHDKTGDSITSIGITEDGVTDAPIPKSMLEEPGKIYAFVYVTEDNSAATECKITIKLTERPKPQIYDAGDTEPFEPIVERIELLLSRTEEAEEKARNHAIDAQTAALDANKSMTQAGEYKDAAERAAAEAEKSEYAAYQSEEAIRSMEENVTNLAAEVNTNALAVEDDRKEVERLAEQVSADAAQTAKDAAQTQKDVSQTTKDVQTIQSLKESVEQTAESAVKDIKELKSQSLKDISTAETQALRTVATEGAEQIKAIETTSKSQVTAIQQEGATQVDAVEKAAGEIIADREQIKKNQEDIRVVRKEVNTASPGIINTAAGDSVIIKDSSDKPFKGLNIYGKSTQVQTTGAQLFDASKIPSKEENGVSFINNGDGSFTISGDGLTTKSFASYYLYTHEDTIKILQAGQTYVFNKFDSSPYFYAQLELENNNVVTQSTSQTSKIMEITEEIFSNPNCVLRIGAYAAPGSEVKGGTFFPVFAKAGNENKFEPYTGGKPSPSAEYPQEIESVGDDGELTVDVFGSNLFDISKVLSNDRITNNGTYLTVNASSTDSSVQPLQPCKLKDFAPSLRVGQEYILNAKTTGSVRYIYLAEHKGVWVFGEKKKITEVMLDSNVRFYASGVNTTANISDITISHSAENISYEPYHEPQSITISTPNGLPGIPVASGGNYTDETGRQWVCDEIDLARGKYVQRVWQKTFDGSEKWDIYDVYKEYRGFSIFILPEKMNRRAGSCNIGIIETQVSNTPDRLWLGVGDSSTLYWSKSSFYDESLSDKGLTNWKAFLNENPMEVMTYLTTPIERDLTPEEIERYKALHTNYPTTVIQNDSGAGMKVDYVADTKAYIDNKFQEIAEQIVTTQKKLLEV